MASSRAWKSRSAHCLTAGAVSNLKPFINFLRHNAEPPPALDHDHIRNADQMSIAKSTVPIFSVVVKTHTDEIKSSNLSL